MQSMSIISPKIKNKEENMENPLATICDCLGPFVNLVKEAGVTLADGIINVVDIIFNND